MIKIYTETQDNLDKFYEEIKEQNIINHINRNPFSNPNVNYHIMETFIHSAKEKHLPIRYCKYHKHKHKKSPWVTIGILNQLNTETNSIKELN